MLTNACFHLQSESSTLTGTRNDLSHGRSQTVTIASVFVALLAITNSTLEILTLVALHFRLQVEFHLLFLKAWGHALVLPVCFAVVDCMTHSVVAVEE